jgi:hypothetical protein
MAGGNNQILTGGRELTLLYQRSWAQGSLFARVINAINTLATNTSTSAIGKLPAPSPIEAINVSGGVLSHGIITCPSEILHLTLTHNAPIQKGIQYITEISTEPNFLQPHVVDHGCSRSAFVPLPTQDASGNTQTYYLRSYAQYHGSDPCKPLTLGGLTGAIGIQMTGSSKTSLLPSTGSGTAQATGQQGGKGLGIVLNRPAPRPKRSLV